jgi:hypothetical protein
MTPSGIEPVTFRLNQGRHRVPPSGASTIKIRKGKVWDYTDRGRPKYSDRSLSQCCFVHHTPPMDWDRTWVSAVRGRLLNTWATLSSNLRLKLNLHLTHNAVHVDYKDQSINAI